MLKLVSNARGQMTIFVALMFQVLFVLFAMAINIGLLVHDKINLQNSVDFGAYYGAQRMAETMNAMAHINYQIRQDYKLLAYRMRVIGGLGFDAHPRRRGGPGSETAFGHQDMTGLAPGCIAFRTWREITDVEQNICRDTGHVIRELPRLPVIAGFIPINAIVSAFVDRVRDFIVSECRGKTGLNWSYVAGAFYAYRIGMFKRKAAFKSLAINMSQEPDDVLDMDGGSWASGIRQTVENNLTAANRDGLSEVEIFNGLQSDLTTDLPPWLAEIFINPQLFYTFHDGRSGGCTNRVRHISDFSGVQGIAGSDVLAQNVQGEPDTARFHSSLGFEKNPWRMAYVGVKATSQPRKPFAPFGRPVQLTARAFAKPFGGRMGPWHRSRWDSGALRSGIGPGQIDTLVVPRISSPGDTPETGGSVGPSIYPYVPNFSKYPGDQLGLKSNLALIFTPNFSSGAKILSLAEFNHFRDMPEKEGDPLSFGGGQGGGLARTMELAAIAPNLFDITYYSIEPKFNTMYGSRGIWTQLQDPDGDAVQVPYDLGTRLGDDSIINVKDQVEHLNSGARRGAHFYFINDVDHLLTSWHQRAESDYSMDSERFGKCEVDLPDNDQVPPNPGNCVKGGRTGYSVKLIARDYLLFSEHEIGGEGAASGPIENPPPEDF